MTFALVDIFAMNFDSSSEMIAPVKPTTAENASSGPMPPWVASAWSMPRTRRTMDMTTSTATLVARNSAMRIMMGGLLGT